MDPFTIAAGISAIGGLFKGLTSLFSGEAQKKAADNAATQHLQEAGVGVQESLQEGDQVAARGATQAAANGGGIVGSSLGVISQISQAAMFNARAQAYRGRTQAQADVYQGKVAMAQGIQGLVGGVVSSASSLVGGFQQDALFKQMQQITSASKGDMGAPDDLIGYF